MPGISPGVGDLTSSRLFFTIWESGRRGPYLKVMGNSRGTICPITSGGSSYK
jgi:hypothetical protein